MYPNWECYGTGRSKEIFKTSFLGCKLFYRWFSRELLSQKSPPNIKYYHAFKPFTNWNHKEINQPSFWERSKRVSVGSRVYDDKKGGDIDLLIIPNKSANSSFYPEKIKLLATLKINLGDQKIDIIVKQEFDERNIVKQALLDGIPLWTSIVVKN